MTDERSWLERNALLVVTVLTGLAALILGLIVSGVFSSDDTAIATGSSTTTTTTTTTTQASAAATGASTTVAPTTSVATTTQPPATTTTQVGSTTTTMATTTTATLPEWIINWYSVEVETPFAFDLDEGMICLDSSCGDTIDIVVNYDVSDDGSILATFQVDNSATIDWVQSGQSDDCDPAVLQMGFEPTQLFIGDTGFPNTGMCVYTTEGNVVYTYIESFTGPIPKLVGFVATWPGFGQ